MFPIKDADELNYYIEQINKRNLSKRELEKIIKNKEYERLTEETKNKLKNKEKLEVIDLVKELGEGFCFIDAHLS